MSDAPSTRPEPEPLGDAEARSLPIFPLPNAVLLPGSAMALHLFEPRYRALARACLEEGPRAMAIATLLPGYETDYHGRPAIAPLAGAGRIVAHHARPDGTYDLLLLGIGRVTLEEEKDLAIPFRRARATVLSDPEPTPAVVRAVAALRAFAATLPAPPQLIPIPPPSLDGPPGRQLDLLCDRYFPTSQGGVRQAVLEALAPEDRARILEDALSARVLRAARPSGAPN